METQSPPTLIADVDALEDLLSTPTEGVMEDLRRVGGGILVLGAGGKVGPTLSRMIKRADPGRRVVAVSRFSDPGVRRKLTACGIETRVCDLLEPEQVADLPRLPNVIHMGGRKFGTKDDPGRTWAMNALVPLTVAQTFRHARIVCFSTLCVYPFAAAPGPGWPENRAPCPPSGEYANACVGRERLFQFLSREFSTPGRLLRLNYAIDLRYGVLLEIGQRVTRGDPIDLRMGYVNVIWQGDASAQAIRALRHCTVPTSPLNLGRPRNDSVREIAGLFGERFGKEPVFRNTECDTAWITDCSAATRLFGPPRVTLEEMIDWTCDWISRGMPQHGKPTLYHVRDGVY